MNPDSVLFSLVSALWIMLPAYLPNSAAAVLGGGIPIDGGRSWRDGKRILGDGKTWRGFFLGILAGIAIGLVEMALHDSPGLSALPQLTIPVVMILAVGSLLGDLAKSFFKRRLGKDRGAKWLIADQYDFVIGAAILLLLFEYEWVVATVTPLIAVWIIIITPVLHRVVNIIGYLAGVKDVPW